MSSKVLVLFAVLCLLGSCWSDEVSTQRLTRHEDISIEPLGVPSDPDLSKDSSFWRFWKFWKWGRSLMNTVFTRSSDMAESGSGRHRFHQDRPKRKLKNKVKFLFKIHHSLIVPKRPSQILDPECEGLSTARALSTARIASESSTSLVPRAKGSVQKEIVTMLFESMIDSIVESWQVIVQPKPEESRPNMMKTVSEVTFTSKKKKPAAKPSKTKRSRSKVDIDNAQTDPMLQSWWSLPDEKSIIRFKNGNLYEGNISMKCMNGEGRFQWADGTVYLGEFKDNEIKGKGLISWKDDCWYEGDFVGNLRHGKGLYVDSRRQRSYTGGWYCGTKHGEGVIYYSDSFKNSYDGEWIHNVRHGLGTREYCQMSGYKGEWDRYVRDGKGLMIWPNHDIYRGEWRNGVMSGYGIYIWDTYHNNSMSLPSITAYRGNWGYGQRNGYGVLNLGSGMGSHYKGEFKNNKKNGGGKFVSNNGLILRSKRLFEDDILGLRQSDGDVQGGTNECKPFEPCQFDICDSSVGLLYHIQQALNNIDKQAEIRNNMLSDYMEYNQLFHGRVPAYLHKDRSGISNFEDLVEFEESSLRKSLRCYETELQNIYYKYATICNSEEINFTPILIRLYLWQLYFDCNIHEKGLTLVEIDMIYDQNKEWKTGTPHGPFDKIYYWQFLNSLMSVSSRLYAKRHQPGPRPDTILASAFRTFMENDILPGCGRCNGHLVHGFGSYVPLKPLYALYRSLGEPHTVRQFLCAVRRPLHYTEHPQPLLVEALAIELPIGHNAYDMGDEIMFVSDEQPLQEQEEISDCADLSLFNFGNLSSKAIINIFAKIFPQLCCSDLVMDLEIQITFFEFFEAFLACAEESIRVKDEEMRWREKFSTYNLNTTTAQSRTATSRTGTVHPQKIK